MTRKNLLILIICLLIVYAVSFFGSSFTSDTVNSNWYIENKPTLTPPNYIFPIVWTIIYFLIALSLYFAWINSNKKEKKTISIIFAINLILNGLWSYIFFGLQNPFLAFINLILILATILAMIFITNKIDKKAAWLLVPYLLWVSFAGVLNFGWL